MENRAVIGAAELTALCQNGQLEKLRELVGSGHRLDSGLARTAIKLFKELDTGTVGQRQCVALAVLLIAPAADLRKLRFWQGYFGPDVLTMSLLTVLPRDRLQNFAEQLLENGPNHLQLVDDLAEKGLVSLPESNSYVAGLIALTSWPNKNSSGLHQTLLTRPNFCTRDVWLLFKWDGTAECCLAGADKYLTNASESWESVLVSLADQGHVERARLLDESLTALTRDFNQFRAGWFSRFHKALAPNADEKAARCAMYIRLLNSAVGSTVSFAISNLLDIDKTHPLRFEDLEQHLVHPLSSKAKQTVIAALQLLENCAQRQPQARTAICILACTALASEQAEVQSRVLKLLAKFGSPGSRELVENFACYGSGLVASVRKTVPAWLQMQNQPRTRNELQARAGDCANAERDCARGAGASDDGSKLVPISDFDELILKAASLLEHPNNYSDYELVLDGILRFSNRDQRDFQLRTSALLQRARKLADKAPKLSTRLLCRLLICWIADELPANPLTSALPTIDTLDFETLFKLRISELIDIVKRRETSALLALPDSKYGWINFADVSQKIIEPPDLSRPIDRLFTLLRVRPLSEDNARALSGSSPNTLLQQVQQVLLRGDSNLFDWTVVKRIQGPYTFTEIQWQHLPCTIFGGASSKFRIGFPSRPDSDVILLEGFAMPNLRNLFFASAIGWIGSALQYSDVGDKNLRFYLKFLEDPQYEVSISSALLLALSISTGDQDISVAGIDAFIVLVAQNRCNVELVSNAMRRLLHAGDCVKANRWSKNLAAVAKVSDKHRDFVYSLLQKVFSEPFECQPPKDLHHLLELIVELHAGCNSSLSSDVVHCLRAISASGKTGKLIKELLNAE